MRGRSLPALLAAALLAAGCGGDSEGEAGIPNPRADQEDVASPEPGETPDAGGEEAGTNLEDTSSKPEIPKPEGEPPAELEVETLVEGEGPRAKPGDTISVQYVGVSYSTGEQFDASWDRGAEPFSFELGSGMVIPGWDKGLAGLREGGRRQLTIPPDQAYGPQGFPPDIGPNETLVFVVDLVEIR